MKIKIVIRKIVLTLAVSVGMISCTQDISKKPIDKEIPEGDYTLVKIEVSLPGTQVPETKALQSQNEDEISEIIVFSFKKGVGTNWDTELKHVSRSVGTPQGNGSVKQYTVGLYSGEWDLWVVTNMENLLLDIEREIGNVDIFSDDFISLGYTKSDLQSIITKRLTTKWPVNPNDAAGSYRIPMWGMLNSVAVQTSSNDIIKTINLYRMVVKVDVAIQRTPDTQNPTTYPGITESQFVLTHVSLHNYNTAGRLIPDLTADAGNWTNSGGGKALRTSLPTNTGNVTGWQSGNRLEWSQPTDLTTANTALEGVIYTFEANAGTNNNNRPCVIIGGKYGGSNDVTYYRADFIDNNKSYLNLLRNHKYKLIIRKIGGKGFSTIEEAYTAGPVNLETEVIAWDEGSIRDIIFDGQYMLGVSQGEIELSKEARTSSDTDNKIKVRTDVPGGWRATVRGGTWLTINPATGNGGAGTGNEITITTDANNTASSRTAYIDIEAGRLKYSVKVTQTNQANPKRFSLLLRDSQTSSEVTELIWAVTPDATPETKEFNLIWEPRTSVVDLMSSVGNYASGHLLFDNATGFDAIPTGSSTVSGTGTKHYKIRPNTVTTAMITSDPFYNKASAINLTTYFGTETLSKNLLLRQIYYNLISNAPEEGYELNAQTESLNIRSNYGWKITAVTDADNILQNKNALLNTTGGNNTTTGDNISVALAAKDDSKEGKTATVTFTNQINSATKNILIKAKESGIYVGMFGGELKNTGGVWQFEKKLYADKRDASPSIQWSTNNTVLQGGTNDWNGKESTYNLATSTTYTNPAAKICYEKDANHTWYLPAQKQLMAIWAVHNSFESGSTFGSNPYWSATESNAGSAWRVNFSTGNTYTYGKTTYYYVRCVREN